MFDFFHTDQLDFGTITIQTFAGSHLGSVRGHAYFSGLGVQTMTMIKTDDGVSLHVEECGEGTPIVFVHEFAGDHRSWEPQVRYFARRYRCITYAARGYPPSDIPADPAAYSQERACDDIRAVLDGLGIDKAHIVGLSMGGFATLHFGLNYADRALSLVVSGCGYGAESSARDRFKTEVSAIADALVSDGMEVFGRRYALGPTRVQYQNKDPRGWQEFADQLTEHDAQGSAYTQRGVQGERPSIYDLEPELSAMTIPTLLLIGDEDWPCLQPSVYMKQVIPSSALVVVPNSGHTVNLEEPERFNSELVDFFSQVSVGRWPIRDPRSQGASITGM
jgi:pimeloyl-ACP methyl ester carboxylesterase